jgi:hypothetical protein
MISLCSVRPQRVCWLSNWEIAKEFVEKGVSGFKVVREGS